MGDDDDDDSGGEGHLHPITFEAAQAEKDCNGSPKLKNLILTFSNDDDISDELEEFDSTESDEYTENKSTPVDLPIPTLTFDIPETSNISDIVKELSEDDDVFLYNKDGEKVTTFQEHEREDEQHLTLIPSSSAETSPNISQSDRKEVELLSAIFFGLLPRNQFDSLIQKLKKFNENCRKLVDGSSESHLDYAPTLHHSSFPYRKLLSSYEKHSTAWIR